jgi:AmmeMemoRadiSam system protein A
MQYLPSPYSLQEQEVLLMLARQSVEAAAAGQGLGDVQLADFPESLQEKRACFVTLTYQQTGDLRGCTGTLSARLPLVSEVMTTAYQTALNDPRFPSIRANEVAYLHVEISVLTPLVRLEYDSPEDLLARLRPLVDGVTLRIGMHQATFLPQVWERVPDPVRFLTMLSEKMGLAGQSWRLPDIHVYTYQVHVIEEPHAD